MKFSHFLTERHEISQCLKKYEKVDFTNQASNRVFPTFQGFPHKQLQTIDLELIQPFLEHVKNIICDSDEKLYEIEMMKNAWIFQNPQQHMNWATVLVGQQGTGKNFYTNVLCQLWGEKYSDPNVNSIMQIVDEKTCLSIIENKKIIVCNELSSGMTKAGKNVNWDVVKSRITDDYIRCRKMYADYAMNPTKNLCNYFFCTNNRDSIKIEDGDRRYFCLEVSNCRKQDIEYFSKLLETFQHEGFYSNLLTYLLQLDCTELNTQIPVMTQLKREMIESNLSYAEQFIRRWNLGIDWVSGTTVWNKFIEWLELKSIDAKFAGAYNKFYDKISQWVDRRRLHGLVQYRANGNLVSYLDENPVNDEVEAEEEVETDVPTYDPTKDQALLNKAQELTPKLSAFERRHNN
jgi:hypothetical protein